MNGFAFSFLCGLIHMVLGACKSDNMFHKDKVDY